MGKKRGKAAAAADAPAAEESPTPTDDTPAAPEPAASVAESSDDVAQNNTATVQEVGGATTGRLSKELRGKTRRPGRSILHGTFATPRTVRTCAQLVLLTQPRRSALNAGYVPQNPRAVG